MLKYALGVVALIFSLICLSNLNELTGIIFNLFSPPNWVFIFLFNDIDSNSTLYKVINNIYFDTGITVLFWFLVGLLIQKVDKIRGIPY